MYSRLSDDCMPVVQVGRRAGIARNRIGLAHREVFNFSPLLICEMDGRWKEHAARNATAPTVICRESLRVHRFRYAK
jgi:hypothetical protein